MLAELVAHSPSLRDLLPADLMPPVAAPPGGKPMHPWAGLATRLRPPSALRRAPPVVPRLKLPGAHPSPNLGNWLANELAQPNGKGKWSSQPCGPPSPREGGRSVPARPASAAAHGGGPGVSRPTSGPAARQRPGTAPAQGHSRGAVVFEPPRTPPECFGPPGTFDVTRNPWDDQDDGHDQETLDGGAFDQDDTPDGEEPPEFDPECSRISEVPYEEEEASQLEGLS